MPAAAQYTANAAEVSPVEAQATALIGAPSEIICLTCDTSTVIPRSLNEPLWVLPHSLIQRSFRPIILPNRSAQNRFVPPSYSDTILPSSIWGRIHSFLPQTPDPYGHWVARYRSSNRRIQATPERWERALRSCRTSRSPPHFSQR